MSGSVETFFTSHPILGGVCFILSAYIIIEVVLHYQRVWKLRAFRGPPTIPFLGNLYTKDAIIFLRFLAQLRKRYGNVYSLFALKKPYIVIADPVIVRRVLSDSKTFFKGEDYSSQFNVVFGAGLVTSNHEKHKKDRSVFLKYFIRSNIATLAPMINSKADEAIQEFFGGITAPVSVDMGDFFAALTLRVFMTFSIGCDFSKNRARESHVCHLVSEASLVMGKVIVFGIPMWDWIPWVKFLKQFRSDILSDFQRIADERKQLIAKDGSLAPDDCLTAMLTEPGMTLKDMHDHYMTLICAGHDTTAYYSSFLAYALAENPEVQEKLVQEIESKLHGKDLITTDDIAEMSYLSKVMQETLRYYAVIPAVTREAAEEVHIKEANITLPKGTNVMMPMTLMNRDPELWEFPSKFNPDRFEAKTNEFTSAKSGFFPFGYGARTCIGNTLAQTEAAIFLVKILRKFKLTPDKNYKLRLNGGISTTTAAGVRVVMTPKK